LSGLDLALIGNSSVAALLDPRARVVWSCLPRFDSDPAFCALLRTESGPEDRAGLFEVDLADFERSEQAYIAHTPILRDAPLRPARWRSRDYRLRAALPAVRQAFLPGHADAPDPPARGQPAHPGAHPAPVRVRSAPAGNDWGQQHVRYVMPEMDLR